MSTPLPATEWPPQPGTAMEPTALVCFERVAHTYGSGITAVVAVHDVTCRVLPSTRVAITATATSTATRPAIGALREL